MHLNHIFQKFGINNRTELAALALSQRYGGIGALAALIFAAIDDDQAASASAVNAGHTVTETFTVMAADGTAEVVTIIINGPKDSAGASGSTARAVIKARGAANGATGTSISTRRFRWRHYRQYVRVGGIQFCKAEPGQLWNFHDGGGRSLDLRARYYPQRRPSVRSS